MNKEQLLKLIEEMNEVEIRRMLGFALGMTHLKKASK